MPKSKTPPHRSPWTKRVKRYYRDWKRQCVVCFSCKGVELHHLMHVYPLGREPDRHLLPLCPAHHRQVHRYHEGRKDLTLRQATIEALGLPDPPVAIPRIRRTTTKDEGCASAP